MTVRAKPWTLSSNSNSNSCDGTNSTINGWSGGDTNDFIQQLVDECGDLCSPCSGTTDSDGDGIADECDDCNNLSGDLNDDLTIDVLDVVSVVNVVLQSGSFTDCELADADTDSNGVVNILDIINVINLILGLDRDAVAITQPAKSDVRFMTVNSDLIIEIDSKREFSGVQLSFPTDIELPISLKDNSHVTQMSHHTNGVMVYVAYTMLNDSFDSHKAQFIIEDGALLDINDVFVMMGTESGQAFELSRYESDELYQTGPYAFELQNVYPNPFNPSTEVSFSLPQDGHVRLSVYNIMGQEVDMIFEGFQSYGEHSYRWNANTFPSGIYYIRLATENRVTSTKAMLMK